MSRPSFMNMWKLGIVLGAITVLGACAKPPTQEMADAETAITEAAKAGADEFAADELSMAQETLADAKAKMESKDFKGAKAAALEVKAKAESAAASVQSNKAAAKTEAEQRMGTLKTDIMGVQPKAIAVKGESKVQIRSDAAALKDGWAGVQSDYDSGHYNRAIDKMDELQSKLDELNTAIDASKGAKKK